jgi:hypothetical protein
MEVQNDVVFPSINFFNKKKKKIKCNPAWYGLVLKNYSKNGHSKYFNYSYK